MIIIIIRQPTQPEIEKIKFFVYLYICMPLVFGHPAFIGFRDKEDSDLLLNRKLKIVF